MQLFFSRTDFSHGRQMNTFWHWLLPEKNDTFIWVLSSILSSEFLWLKSLTNPSFQSLAKIITTLLAQTELQRRRGPQSKLPGVQIFFLQNSLTSTTCYHPPFPVTALSPELLTSSTNSFWSSQFLLICGRLERFTEKSCGRTHFYYYSLLLLLFLFFFFFFSSRGLWPAAHSPSLTKDITHAT